MTLSRLSVLVWLPAIALCSTCDRDSSSSCPSCPPAPTPTPQPVSTPTPTPLPTATPPAPNRPPQGELRFTPSPDADNVINLSAHETLHVNAARYQDPDGDPLYLTVDWGDRTSNHISCGPCRLEHQYVNVGRFPLRAVVTDLTHDVGTKLNVRVR